MDFVPLFLVQCHLILTIPPQRKEKSKITCAGRSRFERTRLFLSDGIYASTLPGARCSLHKRFGWRVCLWASVHLPPSRCSDWPLTHPPTAPIILLTGTPASPCTLLHLYGHRAYPGMRKSASRKSLGPFGEERLTDAILLAEDWRGHMERRVPAASGGKWLIQQDRGHWFNPWTYMSLN